MGNQAHAQPTTMLVAVAPHTIYFLLKTVQYKTILNSKQMIISV